MANFEVNPITGQLDLVGASASYIDGTVADPSALPITVGNPALDSVYLAKAGSGLWLINRKPAGLYCRVANDGDLDDWQHLGAFPEVNADGNWALYNSATPSKELKFDLSGISASTVRTLTVPDASGTLALTSDLPISGTKTYAVFTATDNQPPAADYATLDTRNSIAVLDYDDASTESAVFVGILPEAADVSSGLIVSLRWMASTATSDDVRWSVAWEKSNTDLDSDSFDTATAATATADGTSGIVTVTNITCTTIDSLAAGDLFRLRVQRVGGDGADTMTGDAELIAVEVRSAA
jgi:hypothetical protein